MRYFRRGGPDAVVADTPSLTRLVAGPHPPREAVLDDDGETLEPAFEGSPGGIIAYDDTDPWQKVWSDQKATDPGWYEVDADGLDLKAKAAAAPANEPAATSAATSATEPARQLAPRGFGRPADTSIAPSQEPDTSAETAG